MQIDPNLRKALTGISGILVTPFDNSDQVAPKRLKPIIDRAVNAGVHILVANGNTGEFYGLTTKEAETMVHSVAEQDRRTRATTGRRRPQHRRCLRPRENIAVHQPPDSFVSPRGVIAYLERVVE